MDQMNTKRGSLTIFFAVTVIFVSVIAGFFAYQNQKLVSQIRELTKPTATPVETSIPEPSETPEPSASSSASPSATPCSRCQP